MKKLILIISSLFFLFIAYQFFIRFSLWHFKGLNSDHAIHILMAESFDWSKDWYYWGQNRIGSFIPMLGALIICLRGGDSFNALGLAQISIIIGILFFLKELVQTRFSFLALATITLAPIYPFWLQLSLGHPYLSQLFFNLFLLVCFYSKKLSSRHKALILPLLAVLSVWASELSAAFLLALAIVEFKALLKILKAQPLWLSLSFIIGLSFLYFAKNAAVTIQTYSTLFASPAEIFEELKNLSTDFTRILLFDSNKPFNSLLSWVYLIHLSLLAVFWRKFKLSFSSASKVFLLATLLSFILILLSNWSKEMGSPLRYYTYSYILLAIGSITCVDALAQKFPLSPGMAVIIAAFTFNASIQFNHRFNTGSFDWITRTQSEILVSGLKQEFPHEKSISLIGSYWNTYLIDALSEQVISIPHKGANIRDYRNLDQVLANRYFIIVGNEWLDEFPAELHQHGVNLQRLKVYPDLNEIRYALYKRED
jgi:hypothetical protein